MTREEVIAMAQSVGLTGLGERNVIALSRLIGTVRERTANDAFSILAEHAEGYDSAGCSKVVSNAIVAGAVLMKRRLLAS